MVAGFAVDRHLAVSQSGRLNRAAALHLADLAAPAFIRMDFRHPLADDAEIVKIRLDTVVRAAADRDFELVRQLHIRVAVIETLVDFLRQRKGVDQAVLQVVPLQDTTGRTLEPVPPVSSPYCARNARSGSMFS